MSRDRVELKALQRHSAARIIIHDTIDALSPIDKMSAASALYWPQQCLRGYRLPEPTP